MDHLYGIADADALQLCLNAFATVCQEYCELAADKEAEIALIRTIGKWNGSVYPGLLQRYADGFRRAVASVPIDDQDLSDKWQASVARFAAYKAACATKQIQDAMGDKDEALARAILHSYNRYQAAEYNTAVARARTGKQWLQFSEPDNLRIFPNIKWLPSRSATPREEHMPFYNRVWSKDDPFWDSNQPGTLWNCKCDWEQTDEDPTDGNPTTSIVKPGLDENPVTSEQIFTGTAPYYQKAEKVTGIDAATLHRECAKQSAYILKEHAKDYYSRTCNVVIEGQSCEVSFFKWTFRDTAFSMQENNSFWLKNESFDNQNIYTNAKYLGSEKVIIHPGASSKTQRLKANFSRFHYFETTLSDGQVVFLHIAEIKKKRRGGWGLYSITDEYPKNLKKTS